MSSASNSYSWSDIVFSSKKPLNDLRAVFILAPREMSVKRYKQIIKQHIATSNIVLGISDEEYVLGFENQPQFQMLRASTVSDVHRQISNSSLPHKVYTLTYSQRDTKHILDKLKFKKVLLVNGSWQQSFHTTEAYYVLTSKSIPHEYISPFVDDDEAIAYVKNKKKQIKKVINLPASNTAVYSETEMVNLARKSAQQSYDHTFQTGAVLAKKTGKGYKLLTTAYNEIVPYESFALHHGASREQFYSPPNDLNHYDTVHAEVQGIISALQSGIDLNGSSLFVNLLPCPVCSRVLIKSGITELVYEHDHSDGYAVRILSLAGIEVRRHVL